MHITVMQVIKGTLGLVTNRNTGCVIELMCNYKSAIIHYVP